MSLNTPEPAALLIDIIEATPEHPPSANVATATVMRDACVELGLPKNGTKVALLERLHAAIHTVTTPDPGPAAPLDPSTAVDPPSYVDEDPTAHATAPPAPADVVVFPCGTVVQTPYATMIPQTVDVEQLAESIKLYGITYAVVIRNTPDGPEVIDGATRCRIAAWLGMTWDDMPVSTVDYDDNTALTVAVELNAERRQLTTASRRELIRLVCDRRSWDPRKNVRTLARMLGVAPSTITRDLDAMASGDDPTAKARATRAAWQRRLTGLRSVVDVLDDVDGDLADGVSEADDGFTPEEREIGREYVRALVGALEARRDAAGGAS